jgi:hypothetical protein
MDESEHACRDSAGGETVDKEAPEIEGDAVKVDLEVHYVQAEGFIPRPSGQCVVLKFYPSRTPICHQCLSDNVV